MTAASRRERLAHRFARSSFARNVLGPKIVEPMHDWYHDTVLEGADEHDAHPGDGDARGVGDAPAGAATGGGTAHQRPSGTQDTEPVSRSLAAARSAEAFFAGPESALADDLRPVPPPTEAPSTRGPGAPPSGMIAGAIDVAKRLKVRVKDHNLNVVAAGVAFWALLAIPAALTAVISIYGLAADPDEVEAEIEDVLSGTSEEVQSLVGDQMTSIASGASGGLALGAILGILIALWTVSGAMSKVIATLNVTFDTEEDRSFLKLRGLALGLSLGAIAAVGAAAFVLAILPAVLGEAGLGDVARWLIQIGRFPAMLLLAALGLSFLYWAGPTARRRYRLLSAGAVWATIAWLVISGLFSIYTANFGTYNETYGAIAGVIVLLLWLFITAFMVLIGAEIDAIRDEREAERARAG